MNWQTIQTAVQIVGLVIAVAMIVLMLAKDKRNAERNYHAAVAWTVAAMLWVSLLLS